MLAADALSYRILLADLRALYEQPDAELPGRSAYSFPRYLADARAPRGRRRGRRPRWWRERLGELPGAPELPLARRPERPRRTGVRPALHRWLRPRSGRALGARARSTA